jgi:cell fate (sporulation/competence/biofilm development) regulator YlbF (YheA/YmcA/DUF963 family)
MKAHDHLHEVHEAMKALQLHDPLKEYRETMNAIQLRDPMKQTYEAMKVLQLQDPLKEHREAMKAIQLHYPMKEVLEVMQGRRLQDPLKEYREAMKVIQLHDPMKEVREAMKALQLQDPLKEYREAMKAIKLHDPMKGIREAMKAVELQGPLKEYRTAMTATQSSMREINDGLKALGLENILKTISRQEWPLAHATVDGGITVNADNTVTIDSTTLSCFEIQQIANEIADRTFNRSSEQIEYVITTLVAEIRALKNPALEKLLSLLVYPIIVALIFSIINPITDFYIKESLGAEKRETEKKIKKHVLASTKDRAALDSYRLVSRGFLDVRANPSATSPALGRLHFGQVVMLIEKRKDWSLVAWSDDETEVAIQGWVFSRYLGKFR